MPCERIQRRIDTFLDQAEAASDSGDWNLVAERAHAALLLDAAKATREFVACLPILKYW